MDKINILVLGGNGFIGKNILKKLLEKKSFFNLSATIYSKEKSFPNVNYYEINNVKDFENKKNKIYKQYYDYIINAHGYVSTNDFEVDAKDVFNQHVSSLIYLLSNIKKDKKTTTLINLGTSHEYTPSSNLLAEDETNPVSFYGYCKNFFSNLHQIINVKSGLRIIHIRLFQIYGENQRTPRIIPYIFNTLVKNKSVRLISPSAERDFLHIEDFVNFIEKLIFFKGKLRFTNINVGSGKKLKIEDLYQKINSLLNLKKNYKKLSNKKYLSLNPSLTRLNQSIKWKPSIIIDEGLLRFILYERARKDKNYNLLDFKKASKVSIIMNCYNGAKYLTEALNSVINQSYQNWELIFWDNNSSDNSESIVKSFKDKRIKFFRSPKKDSLANARNKALKKINGSYVAFLDVDDYWLDDKLILQIANMVKYKTKASYTNFYVKRNHFPILTKFTNRNLNFNYVYKDFLKSYDVGFLSFIVSADIIKKHNIKFNNKFEIISDFEFIMKISRKFKFSVCQKPLGVYRMHGQSYSFLNISRHISELRKWISIEKFKKNISTNTNLQEIEKKILYLEYKNYLIDKNKFENNSKFNDISFSSKLKISLKNVLGYL
ncbi:glycosyltransferase [Candidatus Pelagibacter sp. Uisw_106]|uniref:glycosyltransferase n=1 Tax=Candidatus Pelagibacter sp. Uisw_106 TaxID=3230984 RepID=UPI0039EBB0F2